MTYYGTTAASTARNPANCLWRGGVGGRVQYPGASTTKPYGAKIWVYSSTNGSSDVDEPNVPGAFVDGGVLGMYPGDLIIGVHNGGANISSAAVWWGVLNSTESSLATAAYNVTSNHSSSPAWA